MLMYLLRRLDAALVGAGRMLKDRCRIGRCWLDAHLHPPIEDSRDSRDNLSVDPPNGSFLIVQTSIGSLAQWLRRGFSIRKVVGSSPERPQTFFFAFSFC